MGLWDLLVNEDSNNQHLPKGESTSVAEEDCSEQHSAGGNRLKSVPNFRDLGGLPIEHSRRKVKFNTLFRSAAPSHASPDDERFLLKELKIATLLDFRTTYETRNLFRGELTLEDNFITYSCTKGDDEIGEIDNAKMELFLEAQSVHEYRDWRKLGRTTRRPSGDFFGDCGKRRKRYALPLINSPYFFKGVYPTAPPSVKVTCTCVRYILWNDKAGAYFLLKHLNDMGLLEMYRLTVEHTKRELLTIFRILKNPCNYPLTMFCSLGKDRTGIVTALMLSCLGVPRELILEDFHKSEIHLQPFLENIKRHFARIGLTKEEFVLAPKEVMRQLLDYVDTKYGSISSYLHSIGFSFDEQAELFENLTCED